MPNEPDIKEQFQHVFDAFRGVQTVQVITLGLQLGLLPTLHESEGGLTHNELARKLRLHEPYIRVWCQTAYAFGILDIQADGRYTLAPHMETILLDADHPRYLGAFAQGFFTYLLDDFRRTPGAFIDGSTNPFQGRGEAFSAWVSALTHPMQRLIVGRVLPELFGTQLEQGIDVLDIGCGAGQFIFKLAEAYPNSRFVGVDTDAHGIRIARGAAQERGVANRATFEHQSGEQMRHENVFDLALMFEVLHEIPEIPRAAVFAKGFRALKPGGKLFIVDETWPENPADLRDPAYRFSVLVQFSELIWGNVVATESAQTRLLTDAGFVDLVRGDLGGVFTTIVATKPV